jgi:pimeloyl-ACP methyl ester carboxylesterase
MAGPAGAIHYAEYGSGPSLVLSHGVIESARSWMRVVPQLSRRFRTIVYDARGRGGSEAGEVTIEGLVEDVVALADFLRLGRFFHAGHSMGGRVALDHAAAHGDQVRALAVISARPGAPGPESRQRLSSLVDEVSRHGPAVAVAPWIEPDDPLYADVREISAANPTAGTCAALRGLLAADSAVERLAAIAAPTLVVVGARDRDYYHEAARVMSARIPRCEVLTLPTVGHFPNLEVPDLLATELERHFTSATDP